MQPGVRPAPDLVAVEPRGAGNEDKEEEGDQPTETTHPET